MRQAKQGWLTVGLAALALGTSGCAQHYYHPEGDPNTQPGVETDGIVFDVPSREAKPEAVVGQDQMGTAVGEAVVVPSTGPETPKLYKTSEKWLNHNPEPSLKGLDRSGWEPTVFMTDSGTVDHYNYYHRDLPTGYEKRHDANLRRAYNGDATAALDGYKTEGYNRDNTGEMFLQPLKFGYDTILMFPVMVVRPPWGADSTPKHETVAPAVKEKPVDITQVPTQPMPEEPKSELPQLQAWPTDNGPDKPIVVEPLKLNPKQDVIPPLEFDNSPGM